MKCSLAMASFNKSEHLELTFPSIVRQNLSFELEIVLINDGMEDDGTKAVCDKYSKKLDIKYVFSGGRNKNGLIKRIKTTPNGLTLELTSKGLEIAKISGLSKSIDGIFSFLSDEEREQMESILNKMSTELNNYIPY